MNTNPRHINIEKLACTKTVPEDPNRTNHGTHYLETRVRWSDRRYYYLSVQTFAEERRAGCVMQTSSLFSGESILLEQAPRFNARKLAALAATVQSRPDYAIARDNVLLKNHLVLTPALLAQAA